MPCWWREAPIGRKQEWKSTTFEIETEVDVKEYQKLLIEANELLRSAYAIAKRNGEQTNWEAFRDQLQNALKAQHESGLTQRVPDAGDSAQ